MSYPVNDGMQNEVVNKNYKNGVKSISDFIFIYTTI